MHGVSIGFHSLGLSKQLKPVPRTSARAHNCEHIAWPLWLTGCYAISILKTTPKHPLPSSLFPRIFPAACVCTARATGTATSKERTKGELFVLSIYSPTPPRGPAISHDENQDSTSSTFFLRIFSMCRAPFEVHGSPPCGRDSQ